MLEEIWKLIPGFIGYEVSNIGRVRSYWGKIYTGTCINATSVVLNKPVRILKPNINKDGYPCLGLILGSKRKHKKVHQLVALAFIGECPQGLMVCHKNDIKTDNKVENLYYGTMKQNQADCRRNGTMALGSKRGASKLTEDIVLQMKIDMSRGLSYKEAAKKYNISERVSFGIIRNEYWVHVPWIEGQAYTKKLQDNDVSLIKFLICMGVTNKDCAELFDNKRGKSITGKDIESIKSDYSYKDISWPIPKPSDFDKKRFKSTL